MEGSLTLSGSPRSRWFRELIARLLEVNRPRAAFFAVHFETKEIEPATLVRLLTEMATNNAEPEGHYRLQGYEIEQALEALTVSGAVTAEQLAQLEFMYLGALEDSKYGIPHLEQQFRNPQRCSCKQLDWFTSEVMMAKIHGNGEAPILRRRLLPSQLKLIDCCIGRDEFLARRTMAQLTLRT